MSVTPHFVSPSLHSHRRVALAVKKNNEEKHLQQLKEEGDFHPPIDLTGKGFRALNGELDDYDNESIAALAEDMRQITSVPTPIEDAQAQSQRDRALIAILRCAEKTDGQVSRAGLMKILRGEKSRRLAKYEFDHIDEYGEDQGGGRAVRVQQRVRGIGGV